ncbi:MAG: T9SS type A sorting domain-containing protein [Bacteroidetes bacterium]|nr:T9SS type A sorting domain-containing protein [Bacteroidota bacterium]
MSYRTTAGSATVLVSTAIPINSAKILSAPVSSCQNNVSLIVAKVITGQNILYRWTGPTGTLFSNAPGGPFAAGPFSTTVNQVYAQTGTLPPGISGYSICVQGYNGCGQTNTNCTWMRATVSTPNAIVGDNAACPLETKTYSVNIPTGAEVFNWSFSVPGATITPANLAGNIVNVTFPAFTTGTLCVTAGLTCGASSFSNSRCITITSTPSRPGLITGASTACGGTTQSYSIAPVSGANNYTWSFPAAGALIDGTPSPYITTATSVTVSFPAGYNQNRELCVTANNSCSSSLIRCKTIGNQVPEKPASINPSPATWCNNSIITLSVSPVAGATSYNWTLSNGTINSGQGTTSINATWGVGSGNIYVTASNACGTSSERLLNGTTNCRIAGQAATTPFNIYPNPAKDYLTIEFESTKGTYSSKLMNMNGQILISSSGISTDGSNNTKIDLTGIAPGVYILEFTDALSSSKTLITIL